GVYPFSQENRCRNLPWSGSASDRGQLRNPQTSTSQILASKASSVSFAFYSDFKLLVEYDRTMVPRDYRQAYPARQLSERARIDCCHQRLSGQSQPKPTGF